MAKGINKVQLLGHIGKAPEIRATNGGVCVTNFSLATAESFKHEGAWKERTEWHGCVAFGRIAEILRDYAGKGSKVLVEGRLQTREYLKDGAKHFRTEIILSDLTLLDKRPDARGRETPQPQQPVDDAEQPSNVYFTHGVSDEDIPF